MASRDRYQWTIKCPKCENSGVLHISENDYPFMRRLDRNIDSVEGNFTAKMIDDSDAKVTCANCGEVFTR
jgi:ribosomal protein S27E